MIKEVTGRINRRGTFIATDGRQAPATFGRTWRDKWSKRERARVAVDLGGMTYAGIIYTGNATVTLPRRFGDA